MVPIAPAATLALVPKAGFNGDLEQPIRYNPFLARVAAMQAGRNE